MARIRTLSRVSALVALVLLALALVACGGSSYNAPAPSAGGVPNSFVGTLPGTDAFVAITTTNGMTLSYVCDSKTDTWFSGPVANNALDVTAKNGNRLKATLAATGATGTVTMAGKEFPFTAAPAKDDAGLYRAEQDVSGGKVVGGWIINLDGQQRGGVGNPSKENRDDFIAAPPLPVKQRTPQNTWQVPTPTFGTLTVRRVVDPDDHRG